MGETDVLIFYVNGIKTEVQHPNPEETLLQYLRRKLLLTGTKDACGQGGCGACTVMLSRFDTRNKNVVHVSANACLIPICYLHGMAVTTVEGVGSTRNGLHPIQKQLVESHGLQCGFCTPGMVMTMYTLLRNNPNPSLEMIERVLEGNLCRCTGYRPIVDAFKNCPCGLGLCSGAESSLSRETNVKTTTKTITDSDDQKQTIEPSQDPIFPADLRLNDKYNKSTVTFRGGNFTWIRPTTLTEMLELKNKYPKAAVVMGCTSTGYLLRKGKMNTDTIICGTHVEELTKIVPCKTGLIIGAAVTMRSLEETILSLFSTASDEKKQMYSAVMKCLRWLGADQIRNMATVGGHVMSHASNLDLKVLLVAAKAELKFYSKEKGNCKKTYDANFINNGLEIPFNDGVLESVFIPYTSKSEYLSMMKQPHRRGFDYAVVNAGMFVRLKDNTDKIDDLRLCFGGVDSKPRVALNTANVAKGRVWNEETVEIIIDKLVEELGSINMDNIRYRLSLACGFFFKFYSQNMKKKELELNYELSSGTQVYHVPDTEEHVAVWKPLPHYAGESLVTGEAVFIDDMPKYQNELFLAFVTSKKAHANILSIDTSDAMKVPGVVAYVDRKDVPSANNFGLVTKDHLLFAEEKVLHYGQIIGAIAADTRETARKAADLVNVVYEELETVFTIKEAIEKKSFFEFSSEIKKGDVETSVKEAEVVISGELEIGTQEHFYMEPQTCLVIPKQERNEIEIFASCQGTKTIQAEVSRFLGIPLNRIVAKCKRAGGAFGGKSIDSVYSAGAAAVMAMKTGRPVRCVVDRETDLRYTGKRHPTFAFYKVGCTKTGNITSVDINFYVNAGHSLDTSEFVILKGLPQISGCYNFDNFRAKGQVCRTNTPSATPVRGFGAPKMVFIIENILNDVAIKINMDKAKLCQLNMYKEGDQTPSKMVLKNFNLPRCLKECLNDSCYEERKRKVETFNRENRWKKRGISVVPIMYPIGFPPPALNQAIALVHAYLDGSVLLAHGGIDMGQGINTKMIQIAATELGIPVSDIFISETSTNTSPNATNTSASTGTDIYAGAVKNACEILAERIKPYKTANPEGPWQKWVEAAYGDRVSLSVSGYFKMKDKEYDFATHTGDLCLYYTFGAGCSEVEIDCLTGEHQILRTDIVMDLGKSLNPAVDIGQIEGAFTMACGLYTTEEIHVDKNGRISESGPINYKIPTVRNIPREFKVKVLKGTENNLSVYSAKGTGEPPLLLAITVHHAIKEAILAARKDSGVIGNYQLNSPATAERIRMACKDKITEKCEKAIGKDLQTKILL